MTITRSKLWRDERQAVADYSAKSEGYRRLVGKRGGPEREADLLTADTARHGLRSVFVQRWSKDPDVVAKLIAARAALDELTRAMVNSDRYGR